MAGGLFCCLDQLDVLLEQLIDELADIDTTRLGADPQIGLENKRIKGAWVELGSPGAYIDGLPTSTATHRHPRFTSQLPVRINASVGEQRATDTVAHDDLDGAGAVAR